jgi:beta-glucan synthesis-associated protein KRE6
MKIYDSTNTKANSYVGSVFQQSTSGVSDTNQNCYTGTPGGCYTAYGFEYAPGNDGYITWVNDAKPAWTLMGAGMGPDSNAQISQRPIPQEPMVRIFLRLPCYD